MQAYITQLQQDEAKLLYSKQGVTYLGLFGSTARGEQTRTSDIDILVDFNQTKTLFDLANVQTGLESILGRRVDLVLKKNVKPQLLPYIEKDLLTVYEKN